MSVPVDLRFGWDSDGCVAAYCRGCDEITCQQRFVLHEDEAVGGHPLIRSARGRIFVCSCSSARCADERVADKRQNVPAHLLAEMLSPAQWEAEKSLLGLPVRLQRRSLTRDDRVFVLSSELLSLWTVLNERREGVEMDRGPFQVVGIAAVLLATAGSVWWSQRMPADWRLWGPLVAGVVLAAYGVVRLHRRGLSSIRDQLPRFYAVMGEIDAQESEIREAHFKLRHARFAHLRTLRPGRIWTGYVSGR